MARFSPTPKSRAQVSSEAGSAFVHSLEHGPGRVLVRNGLRARDYKIKVPLTPAARSLLTDAGERLAPTLCALADFALDQLERDAVRQLHAVVQAGPVPYRFTLTSAAGPLAVVLNRETHGHQQGAGLPDQRISVLMPDALHARLAATGATVTGALLALSMWGLAYLQRERFTLVSRPRQVAT